MTMSSADLEPQADRPKRRIFTNEYKLAIVAEYDTLTEPGARGAPWLRREGLYHFHLIEWRRARAADALSKPAPRPGRRPQRSREQVELERLRRDNERMAAELARTKAALDVVGKHTRSWGWSPRARTRRATGGRAGDRGSVHRAGAAGRHQSHPTDRSDLPGRGLLVPGDSCRRSSPTYGSSRRVVDAPATRICPGITGRLMLVR
jgi:transposase-like protein